MRHHGAHAAPAHDDERLSAHVQRIAAALEQAGDEVAPELVTASLADIAQVEKRLALGVDRTVVALVGGTGSGKSSLFNAISRLRFADVGAIRPTTDRAAACVWGGPATELLDFLEVSEHRRIGRESVLDADEEQALHGLVLLDMPDHDSVAEAHADQVDRLLPLVDMLIWVVDPQKYADHALHDRYLRALADRQEAMLVLVNQVDTIPAAAVPRVVESVRGLLRADGLEGVEIITTSAVTGQGVADVRELLALTVARSSTAARTADAEIGAVARRLRVAVGTVEPPLGSTEVEAAARELSRAAGVASVADSVRAAVVRMRSSALARPEPPAAGAVEAVRGRWLAAATAGLPERWVRAVTQAVPRTDSLRASVSSAVDGVPLPEVRRPGLLALQVAGLALITLGGVALVLGVIGAVGAVDLPGPTLLAVGAGLLVLGAGAGITARVVRGSQGERAAARYRQEVEERVGEVVRRELAAPTVGVLERHRTLRHALDAAAAQDG
ncbi:GTP-binding protein EngB required for normal cell division [Georgenia satyanarayanai]|uniref:GTP-binding protein EngB required for normal cell division n=1 Tax=Georgenia satyanarayanai TaxID=860221 RepID=A0A2Y9ADT7_9MICO|nr:GTPase [Georgenia satyanarayanai]PYG00218.1 GTP-binding protein EngB required for normal cell division [Georgenia satyanarayanai]SSA40477.1 GTP-binding protein EngB required for normal cell division [Georgenia satyanarayanai]